MRRFGCNANAAGTPLGDSKAVHLRGVLLFDRACVCISKIPEKLKRVKVWLRAVLSPFLTGLKFHVRELFIAGSTEKSPPAFSDVPPLFFGLSSQVVHLLVPVTLIVEGRCSELFVHSVAAVAVHENKCSHHFRSPPVLWPLASPGCRRRSASSPTWP